MSQRNQKQRHSLIIGCGYLGQALVKELQLRQLPVHATTGHKHNLHRLENMGVSVGVLNINEPDTWHIRRQKEGGGLNIYCLVPPGQIGMDSWPAFVAHLQTLTLHKAILASSTVVYGRREREVDADSEVDIDSTRAERQYRIEEVWQRLGEVARIVRFAGLYGPGRIIGRRTVLNNERIPGQSGAWLNLIHISDAARLLLEISESQGAQTVELGCDGRPVLRCEYYGDLAKHLNCPPPVFSEHEHEHEKKRGRRCSNKITIQRTGWQPQILDYKAGF